MSVVQAIFAPHSIGNYPCPQHVEALVFYALDRFDLAYWNFHQKVWDRDVDSVVDPFDYRAFRYPTFDIFDENLTDEQDALRQSESAELERPNFAFGGVEIRWYKRLGRSMSVSVEMSPSDWVAWFDDLLFAIAGYNDCLGFGDGFGPRHMEHMNSGEHVHARDCQERFTKQDVTRSATSDPTP